MCTSLTQLVTPRSTLHAAAKYTTLLASHVHVLEYKTKHVEQQRVLPAFEYALPCTWLQSTSRPHSFVIQAYKMVPKNKREEQNTVSHVAFKTTSGPTNLTFCSDSWKANSEYATLSARRQNSTISWELCPRRSAPTSLTASGTSRSPPPTPASSLAVCMLNIVAV